MEGQRDGKLKVRELTKYEKDMLARKREEHKTSIMRPQVVQGVEYRGDGFRCSEPVICFDDCEVGATYSKSLKLTNISLSFNSFKFQPISEQFAKYFEIEFAPVGRISAGIAAPFKLNFFPQVRQNLDFNIEAACETGVVGIPVQCRFKRTLVELDRARLDFDSTIVGEETVVKLTVANKGGMPTKFEFRTRDGKNLANSVSTMNNFSSNSIKSRVLDEDAPDDLEDVEEDVSAAFEFFNEEMSIDYVPKLDGYSEQVVRFTYRPINVKKWRGDLLIHFSNFIDQEPLKLTIEGASTNVPITASTEELNFGICVFNSVYKEQIVFHNASKNTSKIEVVSPMEVRDFIQFNPVFAFAQPHSSSSVWVKIATEEKMLRYCEGFGTSDGSLSIPFKLICSEQKMPVEFSVRLKLTSQALVCPKHVDFGEVCLGATMVKPFELVNKSLLAQKFVFYQKPEFIEFVPKEVPYVLLPNESRRLSAIFRAVKPHKQNGTIRAKVIVGAETTKELEIKYEASVVKMPLSFSSLSVQFPTLQPGETSSYIMDVTNASFKDYIYEIQPPDIALCGLKVTPLTNIVPIEKSAKIMIEYAADYRVFDFEAYCRLSGDEDEAERRLRRETAQHVAELKDTVARLADKVTKLEKEKLEEHRAYLQCKLDEAKTRTAQLEEDKRRSFNPATALAKYGGSCKDLTYDGGKRLQTFRWLVPLLFKPVSEADTATTKIYVEVQTTVKEPILFCDRTVIDFGRVPVGFKKVDTIVMRNNSDKAMELLMDVLPLSSAFNFLSILKRIEPGMEKSFSVSFEPVNVQTFNETMKIYAENSINITLKGESVYPEVNVHHANQSYMDMPGALVGDTAEGSFVLQNKCEFDIRFDLAIEAQGTQNASGKSPFVFVPSLGTLQKFETKSIRVLFQPEIASANYFACVNVYIEGLKTPKQLFIKATASASQFCVKEEFDYSEAGIQRYVGGYAKQEVSFFGSEPLQSSIVFFFPREGSSTQRTRRLVISNLKLNKQSLEKPVEFELVLPKDDDNMKYFKIDNVKGRIASGSSAVVAIEFSFVKETEELPAVLENVGKSITVEAELRITGGYSADADTSRSYKIECRAYVNKL